MGSPVITLLALVAGLGAAVLLVAGWDGRTHRRGRLLAATSLVTMVTLVATLPATFQGSANGLRLQHAARVTAAAKAREKCLLDFGRPDLVGFLDFVRARMPGRARFDLRADSSILPCVTLNLLPRLPVAHSDFRKARDWMIINGPVPRALANNIARDQQRGPDGRRYLVYADGYVLIRPSAGDS